jgi:hypothetical protein
MPSESKTNTKTTRKPTNKLPKKAKRRRKTEFIDISDMIKLYFKNSSLMSIHITHHTYNLQHCTDKKKPFEHFLLKKFSSAAPSG